MANPSLQPIQWSSGTLHLLDQRVLPGEKQTLHINSLTEAVQAIQSMAVRGAPAIAITGIFALALGARTQSDPVTNAGIENLCEEVFRSRPTAVNLKYALATAKEKAKGLDNWREIAARWETLALEMMETDRKANRKIGEYGAGLFASKEVQLITHCNTGALATAGHGTALGVVRSLRDVGKKVVLYADETRPFLQGSRLTAFEMLEEGIECYILTDGMSGWLMSTKKIDAVIVGCDRIAANGDTANKIGTYNLAIVAKEHKVPFYVCATRESFDLSLSSGKEIPIEMRKESEVTQYDFLKSLTGELYLPEGLTAPKGAKALNPSFDITPAGFIKSFITDFGVFRPDEISERLKTI